ncbi:MAG: hypothetical protein Q8K70_05410 [Bacteroidota bacterium]|nr:hypothetical protein [Bacteroidota bacterium]
MKNISFFIFPLIFISFVHKHNENKLLGTWQLNMTVQNKDTIFLLGNEGYTLKHNYKLNHNWVKTKEDSINLNQKAHKLYNQTKGLQISFLSDSTFKMTKIRSGGIISLNENDYGIYEVKEDTLIITNQTENNKKTMFIIDDQKLFLKDESPNLSIYIEYKKID